MANTITLKWGTAKAWDLESEEAIAAMQKWSDFGVCVSAIAQKDSAEQKQALIAAIDYMDEIWLDWEDKQVTKAEAKKYVLNYGK